MVLPGPGDPAADLGGFHAEWFRVACALYVVQSIGFGVVFALVAPRLPPMPATRLIGYQKPWPLPAAQRTAGRAIAAPPTNPPSTPAGTAERRLAPRTTAGIVKPNTSCDTMNQGQLTFPGSTGLATNIAA